MLMNKDDDSEKKPSLGQMMASVLAAMFGVQKSKNRERDFQYGNPTLFIILGIIGTTLFVLLIVVVVNAVMLYAPK